MKTRSFAAWLFLPILLVAMTASAQAPAMEIEAGYRITDIEGNEDLYRTQINEDEGFLLRSFTFFSSGLGENGFVDDFRISAADLGSGPASALRIEAGKEGAYRLRLGYRTFDSFSALPAFANPLLGQGIIPGQHTYDRERSMFDVDLEFLPGGRFTPFIGYSQGSNEGPGTTTYTVGGDEFVLDQDLDESETEFRVGTGFNLGKVYGSVVQGWRNVEGDETFVLREGGSAGNNPGNGPFGRPVTGNPSRDSNLEVETPFTNLYVVGDVTSNVRLIGDYSRFAAESEGFENENDTGSFVSFAISRFFGGLEETVSSRAKNTTWRGGARAEVALPHNLDLTAGYRTEHRELTGTALIESLFLNTVTFGGSDPRNISEVIDAESSIERDIDTLEAALAARAIGPFSFRVGYSQSKNDLTVAPSLEEIVVPGNQAGDFERTIDTIDLSAGYANSMFNFGASYRLQDADTAVLRTDFVDRDRIRVRAGFNTPNKLVRIGIQAENTNQDNDGADIGFDAETQNYTADFEVGPFGALSVRGAYSQYQSESSVLIRRPETFETETSFHKEDGDSFDAGFALLFKPVTLDASVSRFDNEGTLPFSFDRYRFRLVYDFVTKAGVSAEWSRDEYEEQAVYGQYKADRFGLFLRYRP